MTKFLGWLTVACWMVSVAGAQGIVDAQVEGNEVKATISFPGGIEADLTLSFEQVVGLSVESLGLSAELVDPTDLELLSRFPDAELISIPLSFPVLVWVEPPADGPLSFSGVAALSLHTHNLTFTADTPLRLFQAPAGGPFEDITESMGLGSYRARGLQGSFSEFLIVSDLRDVDTVISRKFDLLDNLLALHGEAIEEEVREELEVLFAAAWSAYRSGATREAISHVEAFSDTVKRESGTAIPDVWRASRDLVNVAGELRATAATLRFSLNLKLALEG